MWGGTTHVSAPNSSTVCAMALKKTDTHGPVPSLLIILVIIFYTALSLDKLLTTAG